jgi:hypothetical protein
MIALSVLATAMFAAIVALDPPYPITPATPATPAAPIPADGSKAIRVADDNGGHLIEYYERYQRLVDAGATFRIDGRCLSACTLVLLWADRVCVTERAALGFHQVRDGSGRGVQRLSDGLMSLYPAPVRQYISAHGGLPPPWRIMLVSGPAAPLGQSLRP